MREPSPTLEAYRFYCLAPDDEGNPRLQLPTIDLDDPNDYFMTDQWLRLERRKERAIWAAAHRPTVIPKAPGGAPRAGGEPQDESEERGRAASASQRPRWGGR